MDEQAKKTALRMIPYGIYVLTAKDADGNPDAATINWVTQTSFSPPLVALALKADSRTCSTVKTTRKALLNVLGKGQQGAAFAFFKPTEAGEGTLSGQPVSEGLSGLPALTGAAATIALELREQVELGDHHVMIMEVVDAALTAPIDGRADEATLAMADLGEKVFYGG